MNKWNTKEICGLLAECGEIALGHYEKRAWKFKSDRSLVTAADSEIEDLLKDEFDRPEESAYLIGEETVESKSEAYIASAMEGTSWIVDPIDGTAPYAHHVPTWGVSIGFMKCGTLLEGAVFLPALGELFITDGDDILYCRTKGTPFKIKFLHLEKFCPQKLALNDGGLISVSQDIAKKGHLNLPNPVQAVCCTVFSGAYLAMGRYLAYIGCVKLWDIGGVLPILFKSGFKGRLISGEELSLKVDQKIYHLSKDHPERWRMRNQMILAPDRKTINYICGKLKDPGR
ncbi:MAG: inositol monophosphatase family protein [Victivallales bacterium]